MLTVREIKDILKHQRISISKRRGQNFLVDAWVKNKIIAAVDIKPNDGILEIGPGLGALTEDLAKQAKNIIAVEKDKALARILKEKLSGYKNLEVVHHDVLKFDIGQKKTKVVGNLPYYITTPILAYLLEKQRGKIKDVFITVQDEVGKRMVAKKDTKDYSALTILVQYFTQAKLLFSIPKRAFYPQPKVNSVFVHLRILNKPRVKVNNREQFFKIVRTCFQQRRKTILNPLAHNLKRLVKAKLQQILQEAGVDYRARAENLSLDDFARIENTFYQRRIRLEQIS